MDFYYDTPYIERQLYNTMEIRIKRVMGGMVGKQT